MIAGNLPTTASCARAIVLSITLAGQPALAEPGDCPCFTSELIDGWFAERGAYEIEAGQLFSCADDPGLTTFDYFDRLEPGPSLLTAFRVDLVDPSGTRPPRCELNLTDAANDLEDLIPPGGTRAKAELTKAQADTCYWEILYSQPWNFFGCPKL